MEHDNGRINIVIIGGSVRPGNFTMQAVALLADEFKQLGVNLTVIDPAHTTLAAPGTGPGDAGTAALRDAVKQATGVVLATPEYHGSPSSIIKLAIENLGFPSLLAGKPVALLGVAAGAIGAIKSLEMLRSISSHIGALVLPGPVSVAGVQQLFQNGVCTDAATEKRIRALAHTLLDYIHGFICPKIALEEMVRNQSA